MNNISLTALRDIASLFSRSVFLNVLNFLDYSPFQHIITRYAYLTCDTYIDLLNKAYSLLCDNYRNEYVFKNELIGHILNTQPMTECAIFNEFRVGKSIADMALFHEESVAYEIKTAYDTTSRLDGQMNTYDKFFDRCYLVIPEESIKTYMSRIESHTGIITMSQSNKSLHLTIERKAERNETFDPNVMMPYLRTDEYKRIAIALGGCLGGIPSYEWYNYCERIITEASPDIVRTLFLQAMRNRQHHIVCLRYYPTSIRQMMLSLNLPASKASRLVNQLCATIVYI